MRMSDRDISDVTGAAYTYLINGNTPEQGWQALFKAGEKVRLRLINAAAMTIFDVRIPGLKMTVVASDGQNIQPVTVDEFRMGVAETYDVIVEPEVGNAYCLYAQNIDRTGFVAGSLTSDASLVAAIPDMDPAPILGHGDMGMDHGSMDHGAMDHGAMDHGAMDHGAMDHGAMDHGAMDHGAMDQDRKSTRLNSSHVRISYAVFCLKKKKDEHASIPTDRHPRHAHIQYPLLTSLSHRTVKSEPSVLSSHELENVPS